MKKSLTEVVFIIDESGSMYSLKNDTIGGFNSMLDKQRKGEGEVLISTVMFNSESRVVYDRVPVSEIPQMTEKDYSPNGNTALYDAVGAAVKHISTIHKYARKDDVPEHTLFIITTDGMENASRTYSHKKLKDMITKVQKDKGWEFIFLGANIDSAETAESIGISRETAVDYCAAPIGTAMMFEAVSEAVCNARMGRKNKASSAWRSSLDRAMNK